MMLKFYSIFLGKNTELGASDWGLMEKSGGENDPKFRLLLVGSKKQCEQLAEWMNENGPGQSEARLKA